MRTMVFGLLLACGSSGSDGHTLLVDVRTDLVPGYEFDTAIVEVADRPVDEATAVDDAILLRRSISVTPGGPDEERAWALGQRVGVFEDLPSGNYYVYGRLWRNGAEVLHNVSLATVEGETGVTVVLTRDCAGVECPAPAGNPGHIACLRGMCVDPRCPSEPETCPRVECEADADCPAPSQPCAVSVCARGACLFRAASETCESGEVCSPDVGCVPATMGADAGPPPPTDAGATAIDAGPFDGGPDAASCPPRELCTPPAGECALGLTVRCGSECEAVAARAVDTPCDADGAPGFCDGMGSCVACDEGASCEGVPTCFDGALDCSGELGATCEVAGPTSAATACVDGEGDDGICDGAGVCAPCEEGAPCQPDDVCASGVFECAGPSCVSTGTRPAGSPCPGGVCDEAGACVPCEEGAACDTGDDCVLGALDCSGVPTCRPAENAPVNTACATAERTGICNGSGDCVDDLVVARQLCGAGATGDAMCRARGFDHAVRAVGYYWFQCGGAGQSGGDVCDYRDDDTCDWCVDEEGTRLRDCTGSAYGFTGCERGGRFDVRERIDDTGDVVFDGRAFGHCGGFNPGWTVRVRCRY